MNKFENDLLKPENKTHLRNALIDWCIGSDGQDGATCDVLGQISWTTEMENITPWCDVVDRKIDNAIGARLRVGSEIVTNSYRREEFLIAIDQKVERIVKAYQEAIDELNNKSRKCMRVDKFVSVDGKGFCRYECVEVIYGDSFYDCICNIWEKYVHNTEWKFQSFVDACYNGSVHMKDGLYCHFGDKATNS